MRVLALFPHKLWTRRLSASRRHDLNALARREDVEFKMSGQGWPDWDADRPALQNVRRIMPDADVVVVYKLDGNPRMGVPPARDVAGIADEYLVAEKLQECWWPDDGSAGCKPAWKQMVDRRVGLVILSHPNDVPRLKRAEDAGARIAVIPHCAEKTVFAAASRPWAERSVDVLLTGALSEYHYPLRCRFARMIREGTMPGKARIHVHPGCWFDGIDKCEAKVREYAEAMGDARVVLCCSSRWEYALAKYVEAAMAGAVVMGDQPATLPDWWSLFIVPVKRTDPDEKIAGHVADVLGMQGVPIPVRDWVPAPFDVAAYLDHTRRTVTGHCTQEEWAQRFVDAVREAKGGSQ